MSEEAQPHTDGPVPAAHQPMPDEPVSAKALAAYGGVFAGIVGALSLIFVLLSPNKTLSARDVATYGSAALFLMTGFAFVLVALNVVRHDPETKKRIILVSLAGIISGMLAFSISEMTDRRYLGVDDCISEFRSQLEEPSTQDVELLADRCLDLLTKMEAESE